MPEINIEALMTPDTSVAPSAPGVSQEFPLESEFHVASLSVHDLRTRLRSNTESTRLGIGTIVTTTPTDTELTTEPGGICPAKSKRMRARRMSSWPVGPTRPAATEDCCEGGGVASGESWLR